MSLPRDKGLSESEMIPDRRRLRIQSLLDEILYIVGKHLSDEDRRTNAIRELSYELFGKLMDRGVELVTDEDRRIAGLPPRGREGWTDQELAILEARRIEMMYAPAPPVVFWER